MMVMRRQSTEHSELFRVELRQLSSAMQEKYCSSVKGHSFNAAEKKEFRHLGVKSDNKVNEYLKNNNK